MMSSAVLASFAAGVVGQERLRVINACDTDAMWIASSENVPDGPLVKLNPGETHAYSIPDGLSSTRFWPKMFCDGEGQKCKIGDSGGPGQSCTDEGCAPPVDSKFEATFGHKDGNCHADASQCDWWDTSGVDGFTLPYKVDVSGDCKADGYTGTDIDCSNLQLTDCPSENLQGVGNRDLTLKHPSTGDVVGCYSPCSKLTTVNWHNPDGNHAPADDIANPYCCPTPPVSSEQCRAGPAEFSGYTKLMHQSCPHVYAYAYDDAVGLQVCPATTVYTWTLFCPSSHISPSPSPPSPGPPSPGPPSPAGCNVGDNVACPAGGFCAGDQCCGDGSTCPSAHSTYQGCPTGKTVDCTGSILDIAV